MTLADFLKKEGEKRSQEKIVRNMLQEGFDYQTIARINEITLEEVAVIAKKAS